MRRVADEAPHAASARADAARSQLMEIYNISPQAASTISADVGAPVASVSQSDVDAVVDQFEGCESELLVELMADPGAIHDLLLPSDDDDSSSSASESVND